MKKTLLLLALFAGSLLSANAEEPTEYLSAYVVPGAQKQLAIQLKNDVDYTACQMTITLPEGMTFAGDAVLSSRSNAHQIKSQPSSDNKSMTVVLFSYGEVDGATTGNLAFKRSEGAVLLADVNIDESVLGKLTTGNFDINGITLSNVEFVKNQGLTKNVDLTLGKTGILGDVDGNKMLNTVDASLILSKLVGETFSDFNNEASDLDCDGNVNTVDASLILEELVRQ